MGHDQAEDAIAILVSEHAVLRGLLDDTARRAGAEPLDVNALAEAAEQLHTRLALHERREEEVLFPEVASMGPVQFVAQEHDRLDGIMDALDRALAGVREAPSAAAAATLQRAVEEMAYCLAGHMLKEEQLVFRMAKAMLGPERLRELGAQMAALN